MAILLVLLALVQQQPRDIVIFITDDQASHESYLTPLSNEAIGGVDFTEGLAHTTLCDPSRCTVLTGLYRHNHGVISNQDKDLCPVSSTIATWLDSAGYRTGLFGKYLASYDGPVPPGWDVFEHQGMSVSAAAEAASNFILNAPATTPLLVYVGWKAPHWPAIPQAQDIGSFDSISPWRPPNYNEADVSDKPRWLRRMPLLTAEQKDSLDVFHQRRAEQMQGVDRGTEMVLGALSSRGTRNQALVIYISDHGIELGEHRVDRLKNCIYEECIKIPFRVDAPSADVRVDTNHSVSLVDIAPTIRDYAGLSPLVSLNGTSLRPLVNDRYVLWPNATLHEAGRGDKEANAIRTVCYTYVELPMLGERELYDRCNDPWQLENIAEEPEWASKVAYLAGRLAILKAE